MKRFIRQYSEKITGVLSCFDRVLFKGYLPLGWADAMENFLGSHGLRIKDFSSFVNTQSQRLVEHAEQFAKRSGRQYIYLNGPHRKEALAKEIARSEGDRPRAGLCDANGRTLSKLQNGSR